MSSSRVIHLRGQCSKSNFINWTWYKFTHIYKNCNIFSQNEDWGGIKGRLEFSPKVIHLVEFRRPSGNKRRHCCSCINSLLPILWHGEEWKLSTGHLTSGFFINHTFSKWLIIVSRVRPKYLITSRFSKWFPVSECPAYPVICRAPNKWFRESLVISSQLQRDRSLPDHNGSHLPPMGKGHLLSLMRQWALF